MLRRLGPGRSLGTYRSKPFPGGMRFDACTTRLTELPVDLKGNFTHGVILIANATIDDCARDPQGSWDMNVRAVMDLVRDLRAAGLVPVFASSDAVFDGTRGGYREDDEANPIITYGRHKAAIEQFLRPLPGPWLVARMSKTVGVDGGVRSLIGGWMEELESGRKLRCATDQRFSPAWVEDVARAIIELSEAGASGLYNIGGPQALSRFELLQMLVRSVRRHVDLAADITPCSIRDFPFIEPRPLDTSVDSSKAYAALGFRFRTMESICDEAAEQLARRRNRSRDAAKGRLLA
jgi:dTDP-4-dehydrorhamnose reductase